jgi:hypothetical protein
MWVTLVSIRAPLRPLVSFGYKMIRPTCCGVGGKEALVLPISSNIKSGPIFDCKRLPPTSSGGISRSCSETYACIVLVRSSMRSLPVVLKRDEAIGFIVVVAVDEFVMAGINIAFRTTSGVYLNPAAAFLEVVSAGAAE